MSLLRASKLLRSYQSNASRIRSYCKETSTRLSENTVSGQTISLPSGRVLGYHTNGSLSGTPIIYLHGHPDSGLTITGNLESRVAREFNVRWIGPDRPGVGLSSRYDDQEVLDNPTDIEFLVEHLNLKEYYIIGTSGGTGFTLACAKALPHSQLKGVGICAGIGPLECGFGSMDEHQRLAMEAWRDHPKESQEYYEREYVPLAQQNDLTALAKKLRREFEQGFSGADREVMLQRDTFDLSVRVFRQCWAQGAWAHAKGMEFHWKSWGFALQAVEFPGIKLWYGEKDVSTTPIMGKYMAKRLKGSRYRELAGLSHITIWKEGSLQEMVQELLDR